MLVEQIIAMTVVFGVLLALLGALGAGSAGVVNGRQRAVATALGKQVIERLQGSAYSSVAMNLASPGLTADSRVTGTAPILRFEGEQLVGGGPTAYRSTSLVSGTTYTLSTFITAVTPSAGLPYRRITVFVDWAPSTSGAFHTERFSSLVYPLDYSSFPAGSGVAEVTGGAITVSGSLSADTFDDVHVALPGARAATSSSTLRTAQATASGPSGLIRLVGASPSTTECVGSSGAAECLVTTLDRMADNDVTTSAPTSLGGGATLYGGASVSTPGGLTFALPSGTADSHASVDACAGCGFGDADGVPWADATTEAAGATTAAFDAGATGGLVGQLWQLGSGWKATASVNHDVVGGGTATAKAQLTAPALKLLTLNGASGFDGAVRVGPVSASATAVVGTTGASPSVTAEAVAVDLWDDAVGGYRSFNVTPGDPTNPVYAPATGTVTVGSDVIAFTSSVQSQPRTTSAKGTSPRTDAAAQHPSLLVVTVDVTITGAHPAAFTLTFDYGAVTARGTWRVS
jgi:hypothetical protein